jgi:hypothetical protein
MKRNFFKKLSFVLASAMVLTTLAPASGALAAGGPKLNSTKKYLHLGRVEEGTNEFNFNIKNKGKGWKYEWTSANQDVAKVNAKNGVTTATGVGSTKVTVVISDKDGEELEKLTAKVTVRDNIEVVKISNLPTEAIAVGEEYDFNRSYVTESGSSKKTSGITRWEVSPATATINDKGVFVASEAGEYTITANSFQSKAKYTEWLASKDSDLVTATVSEKVTVAGSMVEAKQVDKDTVKVTFSSTMTEEDVKKNVTLSKVVGSTKVLQTISSVELDDTGKVAEVSVYVPFEAKAAYVVDYTDLEPVQFVAATTEATDVVTVEIGTTEAEVGKETDLKVKLFNAEGVDITTDDLLYRVTFDTSSASSYLSDDKLTMFTIGETTVITAEYHTYDFDSSTGEEKGNIKVTGVVKCVEEKAIIAKGITAWTIESAADLKYDFNDVKHNIAAGDSNKRLLIKSVLSDDNDTIVMNDDTENDLFTFTSSNENIVMVDPDEGDIYAIKAGSAVIVVKYDDKIIGTVTVSVGAERKAVSLTLDTYAVTLSNNFDDTKIVKITVKDQFGDDYDLEDVTAEVTAEPSDDEDTISLKPANFDVLPVDGKDNQYIIKPQGAEAGTYRVKISANDMSRYVVVTVKTPDVAGTGHYHRAEVDNSSLDLKLASDDLDEKLTISVYQYDKKGVRVARKDASTYNIEIKDAKGKVVKGTKDDLSMVYVLASAKQGDVVGGDTVSGAAIKLEKGTYTVTAKDGTTVINKTYFTVTDTQTAPTFKVDKFVSSDAGNLASAVEDCLTFSLNGKNMDNNVVDIDAVEYTERAFVKTVTIREYLDDAETMYIDHEVKVNTSLSW